jgi:hypothetical protein
VRGLSLTGRQGWLPSGRGGDLAFPAALLGGGSAAEEVRELEGGRNFLCAGVDIYIGGRRVRLLLVMVMTMKVTTTMTMLLLLLTMMLLLPALPWRRKRPFGVGVVGGGARAGVGGAGGRLPSLRAATAARTRAGGRLRRAGVVIITRSGIIIIIIIIIGSSTSSSTSSRGRSTTISSIGIIITTSRRAGGMWGQSRWVRSRRMLPFTHDLAASRRHRPTPNTDKI